MRNIVVNALALFSRHQPRYTSNMLATKKAVIPIVEQRVITAPMLLPILAGSASANLLNATNLVDARARPMRDLRISVTDRCNFRCTYCMPKQVFNADYAYLPQADILSFEEITRVAKVAISLGVLKLRITGGEPLMRRNIETLVAMLAALRADAPALDITLTTNGAALKQKAHALKAAGLSRITVSLDSLDDATFRAINDVDFPVANVLAGIDVAEDAGFTNTKINMVVKRGVNDSHIVEMARYFRRANAANIVRFIEYMDVGASNGWRMDEVLASRDVIARINAVFPSKPVSPNHPGEVAKRWQYADGMGEFGVISSVTEAFCSSCTRARLATNGALYTCLFASRGTDLKALLRGNGKGKGKANAAENDEVLRSALASIWSARQDNYSELRTNATIAFDSNSPKTANKVEMSFIGG